MMPDRDVPESSSPESPISSRRGENEPPPFDMEYYFAALDEVYALRTALAYESKVVAAQTLDIPRLGKNRREHIEKAVWRMQRAARGQAEVTYAGTSHRSLDSARADVMGGTLLTRQMWEDSVPTRRGWSPPAPRSDRNDRGQTGDAGAPSATQDQGRQS